MAIKLRMRVFPYGPLQLRLLAECVVVMRTRVVRRLGVATLRRHSEALRSIFEITFKTKESEQPIELKGKHNFEI